MTRTIRIALIAVLAITLSSLVIGAMVPVQATRSNQSSALSALSDMSVKPAEALPCGKVCFKDAPHHYICIWTEESFQLVCDLGPNNQSCQTISGLCP